jgi:hypothetical protein
VWLVAGPTWWCLSQKLQQGTCWHSQQGNLLFQCMSCMF